MQNENQIECPNCKEQIDVNEIIYHQLEDKLKHEHLEEKKKLEVEVNAKREEYQKHFQQLKNKENELIKQQEEFEVRIHKATKEQLNKERTKLNDQLRKEILDEQNESMKLLHQQLEHKSLELQEFNKTKTALALLQREKEELESKIRADVEVTLNEQIKLEKEKIKKQADEENELKFKQKDEQLNQLKEQLQIAQRKAEQGSMQLQGEVQELAIEEYLQTTFPFDTIEEIKKGAKGGDCIQVVHTREIQNCGKIYYESKRTKEFQKPWIEKFKADMRDKGVDVGVLVTSALPKELDRMGLYEGIWVCTFDEFKGICSILRESIININHAKKSGENRVDKMNLLYNYLTSNEFSMQVEAIVEGFTTMQSDLDKEKRAMQKIWKQREKQIEKVLDNTIGMYGSIKGIAGNAIGNVQALELDVYPEETSE